VDTCPARWAALDPAFDPGLFSLAAMYANAGRLDDALATLDRLLKRNPQAQDALAMRARIRADMARARH